MKTKLIIPEHLQGEYEKRIGNNGKPIEITEKEDVEGGFYKTDFEHEVTRHSIKNLILVCFEDDYFYFVATCKGFLGICKGHLNNGTYPGLTVTIPEHLKHHLPERKGIEFVNYIGSDGLKTPTLKPNNFKTVMWMGIRDGMDLFVCYFGYENTPSTYLGHLNDGIISE